MAARSTPLVANLGGVNVVVGEQPVTLDCSRSFDPDAEPGPLIYRRGVAAPLSHTVSLCAYLCCM